MKSFPSLLALWEYNLSKARGDAGMALVRIWTQRLFVNRITNAGPRERITLKSGVEWWAARTYHCTACAAFIGSEMAGDRPTARCQNAVRAHLVTCRVWDRIDELASMLLGGSEDVGILNVMLHTVLPKAPESLKAPALRAKYDKEIHGWIAKPIVSPAK